MGNGTGIPKKREEPLIIENREFVDYEEEEIQRLNRVEAGKFSQNPQIEQVLNSVVEELGDSGRWEEHWLTVDPSGRRVVYARIYYGDERAVAVTADGEIIEEINYE